MNRVPNVAIDYRPPSSNRPISARPNSAGINTRIKKSTPIKHEPCSSTLAKFHEGVNASLLLDSSSHQSSSNKPATPRHPILDAKEKYKYMSRQKSYVDESLFASPQSARQREDQYLGTLFLYLRFDINKYF